MKKFLLTLIVAITLVSCGEEKDKSKKYTLTFVIYYPNDNDTITVSNYDGYSWWSSEGTNYVYSQTLPMYYLYRNSAPFKVLSYTVEDVKPDTTNVAPATVHFN